MEILYNSIHYIDMIRYFLGNPYNVLARTIKHPNTKELANARSSIIMDYGDCIRANINTNHGHNFGPRHQESCFKFEGTMGAIRIVAGLNLNYPHGLPDDLEFISLKNNNGWQKVALNGSWFPDAFVGPMAGLMQKLSDKEYKYINSVEDAIHTMEVVEECYRCNDRISKKLIRK
jgi:predicted dehydrogenase